MNSRTVMVVLGIFSTVLAIVIIAVALLYSPPDNSCSQIGARHTVTIKNAQAEPTSLSAPRCDQLTFTNDDNVTREIAFGPHEHHVPYDGVAEKFLNQDQSFTITLNATGVYRWHDHLHDEIQGVFTVASK